MIKESKMLDNEIEDESSSRSSIKRGLCLCAGCGGYIEDQFYLQAVEKEWHLTCLQCHQCGFTLHSQLSCYARYGNIYCARDYYRLFGVNRCTRCNNGISAKELVMRVKGDVYHMDCFTCACCGQTLTKGDEIGIRNHEIYCRMHYEILLQDDYLSNDYEYHNNTRNNNNNEMMEWNKNNNNATKRNCNKLRVNATNTSTSLMEFPMSGAEPITTTATGFPPQAMMMLCPSELSSSMESLSQYDSSSTTSPGAIHHHHHQHQHHHQQQQRIKRMRTSFKHNQLRTMKSYFNVNQNPDAKDLKQLAQKTGLSKRILQVWFQNARAKWRRNVVRQDNTINITSKSEHSSNYDISALNNNDNKLLIISSESNNNTNDVRHHNIHNNQLHQNQQSLNSLITFQQLY